MSILDGDIIGDVIEMAGTDTADVVDTFAVDESVISFGASLPELQDAATLSEIAKNYDGTPFGEVLTQMSDVLSGADMPGMETIKTCVADTSLFYGIEPVKVFYEQSEPGVQFSGYTPEAYDNWIGGDPAVLSQYAQEYGNDFISNVFAHEMGHHVFDQMGFRENMPGIANEAASDYLAGLYAGARGLDPEGFSRFLAEQPVDGVDYPDGIERSALFMEGYNTAHEYTWNDFQSILDDPRFDLRENVEAIAEKYC